MEYLRASASLNWVTQDRTTEIHRTFRPRFSSLDPAAELGDSGRIVARVANPPP